MLMPIFEEARLVCLAYPNQNIRQLASSRLNSPSGLANLRANHLRYSIRFGSKGVFR